MHIDTVGQLSGLTFSSDGVIVKTHFIIDETNLPKRYIINKDATILFWNDGTKTVVKRSKNDKYDKRLGFLTAYFQKNCGMSKNKANKYLDNLEEE